MIAVADSCFFLMVHPWDSKTVGVGVCWSHLSPPTVQTTQHLRQLFSSFLCSYSSMVCNICLISFSAMSERFVFPNPIYLFGMEFPLYIL